MSGLAAARKFDQMGLAGAEVLPCFLDAPIKANGKLFVGGMAAADSSGYFVDPTAAAGLFLAGIVREKAGYPQVYDNTGGANGDIVARVAEGIFTFSIGTAGDALTVADRYAPCFVMDDQTVGKTDGGATPRSLAGIFMGLDSTGTRAFVMVSAAINAAILAAFAVGRAALTVESISAAGAISVATDVTLLTIAGTVVYTLANGTKLGQRKTITCISATATPVGSVVVATPRGFATLTAIGAIGPVAELIWTATGWIFASQKIGTIG